MEVGKAGQKIYEKISKFIMSLVPEKVYEAKMNLTSLLQHQHLLFAPWFSAFLFRDK